MSLFSFQYKEWAFVLTFCKTLKNFWFLELDSVPYSFGWAFYTFGLKIDLQWFFENQDLKQEDRVDVYFFSSKVKKKISLHFCEDLQFWAGVYNFVHGCFSQTHNFEDSFGQ